MPSLMRYGELVLAVHHRLALSKPDDFIAARQQTLRGRHTDESRRSGNENVHGLPPERKAGILP